MQIMRINNKDYNIGMTKEEFIEQDGIGENVFEDHVWYYTFKKNYLFGKEVVFIEFDNDIAVFISFRFVYGKIRRPQSTLISNL
ncbi:Uncharacterised protein [Chryseobacterium indologenes]|nr:Uncharacterised protein [Chryseobacterium indologenes]